MPDKDGNETPAERRARERDDRIMERLNREAAEERAAKAERLAEERMGKAMDADFEKGIEDLFGASLKDIQKAATSQGAPKEVRDAVNEARRLAGKGKYKQARKVMNQNKAQIKKTTKRYGCAVFAIAMLGIGSSVVSGLAYGVSEIISALGH